MVMKRNNRLKYLVATTIIFTLGTNTYINAQENIETKGKNKTNIVYSDSKTKNGWVKNTDGSWSYYKNGDMLKYQWLKENGKWYYFEYNGKMIQNDIREIEPSSNIYYIFDENGAMIEKKGWIRLKQNDKYSWYYGNGNGTVKSREWLKENGKWYYFYRGKMVQNENLKYGDIYYIFDNSGAMIEKKGWIRLNQDGKYSWYYGNGNGTVKNKEWLKENGKWYYFYRGKMVQNDSLEYGDICYIFDNSGAMIEKKGWIRLNQDGKYSWYYGNGNGAVVIDKVIEVDGKKYGFGSDGSMAEGWLYIKRIYSDYINRWASGWVYGNEDGTLKTDKWVDENGKKYYLDRNGIRVDDDVHSIDGKSYVFDRDGVLIEKNGWIEVNEYWHSSSHSSTEMELQKGEWYYYGNGDGTVRGSGWLEDNGNKYYLKYGIRLEETIEEIDGVSYIFGKDGPLIEKNGWIKLEKFKDQIRPTGEWIERPGGWYYGNGDGTVKAKQWLEKDGKWYYLGYTGSMYNNGVYEIDGKKYTFDKDGVCTDYVE